MYNFLRLLLSLYVISSGYCANILFVSLLTSYSHHIWNEALVSGLLENGHNITMISHDKATIKSDNYTVLYISDKTKDSISCNSLKPSLSPLQAIAARHEFSLFICGQDLKSDALRNLMSYPKDSFDLIIFDVAIGHCFYPLVEYFGRPLFVAVSAYGLPPYIADAIGYQNEAHKPFYTLPYTGHMSFLQRLESVLLTSYDVIMKRYYYLPASRKQAQSVFGEDIRTFDQVEDDFSLLISRTDPTMDYAQSLPPNIIPVGGLHIKPAKKLPEDLSEIMDGAQNGAVYISFGTNVKARCVGDKIRNFVEAFSKLSEIVLWKLDEEVPNLPKNVIMRKWFPQNDILAHRNLKLFITHGGGLSTDEAKYYGVPVIGVPFMIDQHGNVAKIEHQNVGMKLDYSSLTTDKIYDTIMEVIGNEKYRDNMKLISRKFRDQLQSPLDRAVFWIEHVLRNGDAKHLEPASRHMKAYQTIHLDIFIVIMASFLLLVFALYTIACLFVSFLRKSPTKKTKKH